MKHLLYFFFCFIFIKSSANNLVISNGALLQDNTSLDYAILSFDISWDNSWRDNENWDAIWVFIKFNDGTGWSHAELNYVDGTNDGHIAPAGSSITTPSDGKGAFIYRSTIGSGNVSFNNIQLRWDYAADGLTNISGVNVNILGIEMVYVPGGDFWLGDGGFSNLQGHFEDGITGNAFEVTSESAITLGGGGIGSLGNNNGVNMSNNGDFIPAPYNSISMDDFNDAQIQLLPASFPKGYQGFYCMKYELTQGEYTMFLNLLTAAQASTRFSPDPHSSDEAARRYNISGTHPNLSTISPHLPAIYLEYYDGAAFADWSGLRPMTELEFEKASRGFANPVPGEYAWGSNILNANSMAIINLNDSNETILNNYSVSQGNAWFDVVNSLNAVVRVGIFSANPLNTGRETSGATYWGIMEMSGNCWERAITVGRPEGRAFAGTHGDGELNLIGNATNLDWPGHSGLNGVDDVIGAGYRGGGFQFPTPVNFNMRISARRLATSFYNIRYFDDSMRLVRTFQH